MHSRAYRFGAALTAVFALLLAACAPAAAPSPTTAPAKPAAQATTPPKPAASATKPAAAAASPAAAAASPAAKPSAQAMSGPDWDKVVAAAKQEGTLVLATHAGSGYQKWATKAQEEMAKLGIKLEATTIKASDFAPRVLAEQRNGQFLWDLHVGPASNMYTVVAPAGGMEPIKPFLDALPADVKDNSKWAGGFELFSDPTNPVTLITQLSESGGAFVNTEKAGGKIAKPEDLLDPKWKGQIVIYDPTVSNGGSMSVSDFTGRQGEDFVKKLVLDQEARYVETSRQATEWIAQGRYPIGFGLDATYLAELQAKGVGTSVVREKDFATYVLAHGVSVLKNAPHPNATKVFLNYFLSQPGQDTWADISTKDASSRRLDVKVYHPEATPDYKNFAKYKVIQGTASGNETLKKTLAITKQR